MGHFWDPCKRKSTWGLAQLLDSTETGPFRDFPANISIKDWALFWILAPELGLIKTPSSRALSKEAGFQTRSPYGFPDFPPPPNQPLFLTQQTKFIWSDFF